MKAPPSDDELLRLLHEVELREDAADEALRPADEAPRGDACPFCGEPAEHLGDCRACGEVGCLPPDEWAPGMGEPCLVVCVRCARTLHGACAAEDEAGNPRCPTCAY